MINTGLVFLVALTLNSATLGRKEVQGHPAPRCVSSRVESVTDITAAVPHDPGHPAPRCVRSRVQTVTDITTAVPKDTGHPAPRCVSSRTRDSYRHYHCTFPPTLATGVTDTLISTRGGQLVWKRDHTRIHRPRNL